MEFTADSGDSSVKITDACSVYAAADQYGILKFNEITNPDFVATTDAFTIIIRDSADYEIMTYSGSDVTYTPTVGEVSSMAMTGTSYTINTDSDVTFVFAPLHNLPEGAIIYISLDSDIFSLNCDITAYDGFDDDGPSCAYDAGANQVTLSDLFDEPASDDGDYSYVYDADNTLSLTFESITLPDSAVDVVNVVVTTVWVEDGSATEYQVDSYTETASVMTVEPDDFTSAVIEVSADETYSDATFSFEMTTTNTVPSDGMIRVLIPPEVWVDDHEDIACSNADEDGVTNNLDSLTCDVSETEIDDETWYVVIVSDCFSSGDMAPETAFSLHLSGMKTPLSTQSTSSFEI